MNEPKAQSSAQSRGKIIAERIPQSYRHTECISMVSVFCCSYFLTPFHFSKTCYSGLSKEIETLGVLEDPSLAWSWLFAGLFYVWYHSARFLPVCHIPAAEKSVLRKRKSLAFTPVVCEQCLEIVLPVPCRRNESSSVFLWLIDSVNFSNYDLSLEFYSFIQILSSLF